MRVAHVGNVANIAYLNTKLLRRAGVEADIYYYDFDLCLAQPEWEDADIEGAFDLMDPRWRERIRVLNYQRPAWAHPVNMNPCRGTFAIKIPFSNPHGSRFARFLSRWERRANRAIPAWYQYQIVRRSLKRRGLNLELSFLESIVHFDIYRFREIVQNYDLVQAYGLEPIHCLIDFPVKPYIAYEFGTMREIPFEKSLRGRLLAAAYQQANKVIITNADVRALAEELGLRNYVFIPHPVDEEKFYPGLSRVRGELEDQYGRDVVVLFAPARHDWAVKGNDKMIRAAARLMGQERKPIVLVLTRWGQEVERSQALIAQLGIESQVKWLPLLAKRKMAEYYRAADIVLDQFNIGTFGLTTPEAMACARPVMVYFDAKLHEWCYEEMPPILSARSLDEIYQGLFGLVRDSDLRERLGRQGREWFLKYHSGERIADLHIRLYQEVLA
jgi:glycosyltransferase involved in cell wall biosynthesis